MQAVGLQQDTKWAKCYGSSYKGSINSSSSSIGSARPCNSISAMTVIINNAAVAMIYTNTIVML